MTFETYQLDEVFEFRSGLSKPKDAFGRGFPFLTFKDVFYNYFVPENLGDLVESSETERAKGGIRRGDIFLTRTSETQSELGMSCVALRDVPNATFNGFAKRLRPKGNVEIVPEFAAYYFRSPDFRDAITALSIPSTRASLNEPMLGRLQIRVPDLAMQKSIGTILKAFDDKIDLLRDMNATLEEIARTLFLAWFVDFRPVHAKAKGAASFRGMPKELFDLLPDSFEPTEIGPIPKGWLVDNFKNHFDLTMGQSPPGSTYNDKKIGLPFFQGRTDFGFRYPENRKFCSQPTRLAKLDDTLVSVRAPVGDVNMAWEQCCIGRGIAALRHRSGSRSYTYYSAWSFRSKFDVFDGSGTIFGSISKRQLEGLEIVAPPTRFIEAFEQIAGPMDSQIRNQTAEIRTLTEMRDNLLPKLVTGELEAPSLEALRNSEAT